jgi:hypothetical protein
MVRVIRLLRCQRTWREACYSFNATVTCRGENPAPGAARYFRRHPSIERKA